MDVPDILEIEAKVSAVQPKPSLEVVVLIQLVNNKMNVRKNQRKPDLVLVGSSCCRLHSFVRWVNERPPSTPFPKHVGQ